MSGAFDEAILAPKKVLTSPVQAVPRLHVRLGEEHMVDDFRCGPA